MSIRNNLHTHQGLKTYANGMSNSASDKAKINKHLVPGTILEIGCGNGAYLETLTEDQLELTTAIDMNAQLLLMAQKQVGDRVRFQRADIFNLPLQDVTFDNIVMSSVLHELYSELRTEAIAKLNCNALSAEPEARTRLQQVMRHIWELLSNGGRLIIRDGVKSPGEKVAIKFKNHLVRHTFARFVDEHPWFITYEEHDGLVYLSEADAFEFLSKYIYTENWDVEVLERFGWASTEDISRLVGSSTTQYDLVHNETYLIPWLKERWSQDVEVYNYHPDLPDYLQSHWPDSNMLMVFEKPI